MDWPGQPYFRAWSWGPQVDRWRRGALAEPHQEVWALPQSERLGSFGNLCPWLELSASVSPRSADRRVRSAPGAASEAAR